MKPRIVFLGGDRAEEVCFVVQAEFVAGRDEAVTLSIADPNMSRRHFAIFSEGDRYELRDLGSVNGTRVNGEKVQGKCAVVHGDRIEAGDTYLGFFTEEEAPLAEPAVYFDDDLTPPAETIRLSRGNELLNAMLDAGTVLRDATDVAAIRDELFAFIFSISPADRAALLLLDRAGLEFEFKWGRRRGDPHMPVEASRTVVQRVLKDGAPIVTNDLTASGMDRVRSLKAEKIRSILCVPLLGIDRLIGVIYADARNPDARFERTHLEMLTAVADLVANALDRASLVQRLKELETSHSLVGESPAIAQVVDRIAMASKNRSNILIRGESGTGKEVVAQEIHRNSDRARGPFVAVNCGAISGTLAESELFGHEKGSFTGALAQRKGKFELASGGTLFLDELGELPLPLQVMVLRAIGEREICRLGGKQPIKVDIRIISATNRDLEAAMATNEFREDLYYRLNVHTISMPPLRDRSMDILLLAQHFVLKFAREAGRSIYRISPEAEQLLIQYHWPGNVRELQNAMEAAVGMCFSTTIQPDHLPITVLGSQTPRPEGQPSLYDLVDQYRRTVVIDAFNRARGNLKEAAAILGITPVYLYQLLKTLKLTHLRNANSAKSGQT